MIKEGTIIEGPIWPEPVEIKKVIEIGEYIHIIGATIYSGTHIDQLIPKEELEKLRTREFVLDFSAPGSEAFLALESQRYRFASLFDPLLAMNTSKIDALPFQIEAVYGYILKLPRIRFLLADDPGAGKTIMAGLIIKGRHRPISNSCSKPSKRPMEELQEHIEMNPMEHPSSWIAISNEILENINHCSQIFLTPEIPQSSAPSINREGNKNYE